LTTSRKVHPEAYDAYLKGLYYWEKLDEQSIKKALEYFQLATELDPEWADPYAGLANAWNVFSFFGILPKSVVLPKVYPYLNKAIELDPNSAKAHYVAAILAVWTEWDWEKGEREFLRSIELDPNDALCRMYYAHLLMILRRSNEADQQANIGLELDPMKPLVLGLYGVVMRVNNDDGQGAIQAFEKSLSIDPDFGFSKINLNDLQMENAYKNGEYEKWIEIWNKKAQIFGHWNKQGREAVLKAFHENGHIAAIEEMFRMNDIYGDDCYMSGGVKLERYIKLGNNDKAIECLEKDYEIRGNSMPYISSKHSYYEQFKDNPRYVEILRKMNLPLPKN
jgi:adenylate cyclase